MRRTLGILLLMCVPHGTSAPTVATRGTTTMCPVIQQPPFLHQGTVDPNTSPYLSLLFMEPSGLLQIGKKCQYQNRPASVRPPEFEPHATHCPNTRSVHHVFSSLTHTGTAERAQKHNETWRRRREPSHVFSLTKVGLCSDKSMETRSVMSFSFVALVAQSKSTCQTRAHELHLPTC